MEQWVTFTTLVGWVPSLSYASGNSQGTKAKHEEVEG
jgi:hypothetical protein